MSCTDDFLIVGTTFHLVTVFSVEEIFHVLFVFSRYKRNSKPIKEKFTGY